MAEGGAANSAGMHAKLIRALAPYHIWVWAVMHDHTLSYHRKYHTYMYMNMYTCMSILQPEQLIIPLCYSHPRLPKNC